MQGRSAPGFSVSTRCETVGEFITTFWDRSDDRSIVVNVAEPRAVGTECAFAILLVNKKPVLAGTCVVLDVYTNTNNPFKRVGMRLGIQKMGPDSERVFAELASTRVARSKRKGTQLGMPVVPRTTTVLPIITIEGFGDGGALSAAALAESAIPVAVPPQMTQPLVSRTSTRQPSVHIPAKDAAPEPFTAPIRATPMPTPTSKPTFTAVPATAPARATPMPTPPSKSTITAMPAITAPKASEPAITAKPMFSSVPAIAPKAKPTNTSVPAIGPKSPNNFGPAIAAKPAITAVPTIAAKPAITAVPTIAPTKPSSPTIEAKAYAVPTIAPTKPSSPTIEAKAYAVPTIEKPSSPTIESKPYAAPTITPAPKAGKLTMGWDVVPEPAPAPAPAIVAAPVATVAPTPPVIIKPRAPARVETRTPGSDYILPANPLAALPDASLDRFVDRQIDAALEPNVEELPAPAPPRLARGTNDDAIVDAVDDDEPTKPSEVTFEAPTKPSDTTFDGTPVAERFGAGPVADTFDGTPVVETFEAAPVAEPLPPAPSAPISAVHLAVIAAEEPRIEPAPLATPARARRSRWWLALAVVPMLAAAGAYAVYAGYVPIKPTPAVSPEVEPTLTLSTVGANEMTVEGIEQTEAAPPAPPENTQPIYAVLIKTFPGAAHVVIDDQSFGMTPTYVKIHANTPVDVQITRPGFKPVTRTVTSTHQYQQVFVQLQSTNPRRVIRRRVPAPPAQPAVVDLSNL